MEKEMVKTTVRFDRSIPEQDKALEILKEYCDKNDISMGAAMTYFVLKATEKTEVLAEHYQEEYKDINESREFQEKYKDIAMDIFGGMFGEKFRYIPKYEPEKNEKL